MINTFSGLGADEICRALFGSVPPFFNQYDGAGKFIVVNGSGEHHDLTYHLVGSLPYKGLNYVHIDAHSDSDSCDEDISCSNFVRWLDKYQKIERIIFAGTEKPLFSPTMKMAELPEGKAVKDFLSPRMYLSVDLDVLKELENEWFYYENSERRFRTNGNWFCQGNKLSLESVCSIICEAGKGSKIVGADICGALQPLSEDMVNAYRVVYTALLSAMQQKD